MMAQTDSIDSIDVPSDYLIQALAGQLIHHRAGGSHTGTVLVLDGDGSRRMARPVSREEASEHDLTIAPEKLIDFDSYRVRDQVDIRSVGRNIDVNVA